MFLVSSTRRSPALATLLLVMSTTLQPFLLPTVQASVVPGIVRQMRRPSMDSNTNRALATGLLGDMPPDANRCVDFCENNDYIMAVLDLCNKYQQAWLNLTSGTNGTNGTEYKCENIYCSSYCSNVIANTYCRPDEYAAYHKVLLQDFADIAEDCKQWAKWIPPLDSPPRITNESLECASAVSQEDPMCAQEAAAKVIALRQEGITDRIELSCKGVFESEKCLTVKECQSCSAESVKEYFAFFADFWSPEKVECAKWASDKPKPECTARCSTERPVENSCDLMLTEKGELSRCVKEAHEKTAQIGDSVEHLCKFVYYSTDCSMKAACELCTDFKDFAAQARKDLDKLSEQGCKPWSSDEPKLECPSSSTTSSSTTSSSTTSSSNTLLIVGIIIGVIVILVVIGVAVYCLCFSSDKSAHSSKAGGGGGSRASSKINSGKAGSTMGSKQQSRASAGAKQQSRIGAKHSSRA